MNNYYNNYNNSIVLLDMRKLVLNKSTLYDRLEIEHREKNTYYNKIIDISEVHKKDSNENKHKNILINNGIRK